MAPGKLMAVKVKDPVTAVAGVGPVVFVEVWARATATERTTRAKTAEILYFKASSPFLLNLGPTGRLAFAVSLST